MEQILPFLVVFMIALALGFLLGNLIRGLKSKNKLAIQKEKNNQLLLEIEKLKKLEYNNLNEYKKNIDNTKNELLIKLAEVKREREDLRKEKELLYNELTRKNADYEHLLERQSEQKTKNDSYDPRD